MQAYLDTARRYRWIIVLVLALTWGTGGVLAYDEYTTSFEAFATIWTDRQSQQFASVSPQDPGFGSFVSPATAQAGVLSQLLQTKNFLREVVGSAALPQPAKVDEQTFYQDVGKRFRVDLLGTNLMKLSYRARDPRTGARMVTAALSVRQDRLLEARSATSEAAATYYRSQLVVSQRRVTDAQRELDTFDRSHGQPLSASERYTELQLQATLSGAKARADDLMTRIEGSITLPSVLQLAETLDFQVIDTPLDEIKPSGGTKPAATIAGAAVAGGLALVGLLIVLGTLARSGRNAIASGAPVDEAEPQQLHTGALAGAPATASPTTDTRSHTLA